MSISLVSFICYKQLKTQQILFYLSRSHFKTSKVLMYIKVYINYVTLQFNKYNYI